MAQAVRFFKQSNFKPHGLYVLAWLWLPIKKVQRQRLQVQWNTQITA